MNKSFILVVAMAFCAFSSFAEDGPTRVNYRIKIDEKWIELSEITSRAADRLKSEVKEFKMDTFRCNFWIDPDSKDKFIAITFAKGVGQPGHRVYFSREGRISGTWSGIMSG